MEPPPPLSHPSLPLEPQYFLPPSLPFLWNYFLPPSSGTTCSYPSSGSTPLPIPFLWNYFLPPSPRTTSSLLLLELPSHATILPSSGTIYLLLSWKYLLPFSGTTSLFLLLITPHFLWNYLPFTSGTISPVVWNHLLLSLLLPPPFL